MTVDSSCSTNATKSWNSWRRARAAGGRSRPVEAVPGDGAQPLVDRAGAAEQQSSLRRAAEVLAPVARAGSGGSRPEVSSSAPRR